MWPAPLFFFTKQSTRMLATASVLMLGFMLAGNPAAAQSAIKIVVNDSPTVLGTYDVVVSDVFGDYVLTVNGGNGFSATGITTAVGAGTILDFGDVIVRVAESLGPAPAAGATDAGPDLLCRHRCAARRHPGRRSAGASHPSPGRRGHRAR